MARGAQTSRLPPHRQILRETQNRRRSQMTGRDPRLFTGAAGGATQRNTGCNTDSGETMHGAPSRYRAKSSMALAEDAALPSGPGLILLGVFETLECATTPYCVLKG